MKSNAKDEQVRGVISDIRVSGFASVVHWTIVFTDTDAYFLKHGSNYVPLALGVLNDSLLARRYKKSVNAPLAEILGDAKEYHMIPLKNLDELLDVRKAFGGLRVAFETGDGESIVIKLNNKQAKVFQSLASI